MLRALCISHLNSTYLNQNEITILKSWPGQWWPAPLIPALDISEFEASLEKKHKEAHPRKLLATKPNIPSLIPETHIVEGES